MLHGNPEFQQIIRTYSFVVVVHGSTGQVNFRLQVSWTWLQAAVCVPVCSTGLPSLDPGHVLLMTCSRSARGQSKPQCTLKVSAQITFGYPWLKASHMAKPSINIYSERPYKIMWQVVWILIFYYYMGVKNWDQESCLPYLYIVLFFPPEKSNTFTWLKMF